MGANKLVHISSLRLGLSFRPVDQCEDITLRVYESMLVTGWQPKQPIHVFSNGVVHDGNSRLQAILRLQQEYPDKFAEFFPDGKIKVEETC